MPQTEPTEAIIGYDSLLECSLDDEANWDVIGEVKSITPPGEEGETIEATHLRSPGRMREFLEGLYDPGEVAFTVNMIPGGATDAYIRALKGAGAVRWRLTWPNAAAWKFSGVRRAYQPGEVVVDGVVESTVTIKVTGETDIVAAAAPVNAILPAISGVIQQGHVLTAYPGQWSGGPTFAYQWKNEGANISGATSQTYTPVVGDVGDNLTVTVTATNSEGSASATSAETIAVLAA